MTKKKVQEAPKHYEVVRGIESDDWRYEPGEIISDGDIEAGLIAYWLTTGVLKDVKHGNG